MSLYLLIPLVLVVGLYLYLTWNYSHWKKRGIKGPKPKLLVGNFPLTFYHKKSIAYDYENIYKAFKGKETFVGTYFAREPQLLILDRELVRDVYVKNFKSFHDNDSAKWFEMDPIISQNPFFLTGEEWKAKRAEITPALSVSKLKAMYPVMQITARKITPFIEEKMSEDPKDGLDAKDICQRFTTENMTNCLYGVEAAAFTDNSPIRDNIRKLMDKVLSLINYYFMCTMFPFATKFMKKPGFPKPIIKFFVDLMKDALEARRSSKVERFDILGYLLNVQEKKDLSDIALVGHALTFFTDGTETSSVALANTLFFLARHQDAQTKLREEINQSLTKHGEFNFDSIQELPYMEQVINESIRLFPPVAFSTRVCTEPIVLEDSKDKKVFIKKDDSVILPVFSIHHDEEYFKDAWEFNPDRFSPELGGIKKYRDMGAFYPFGEGPRQCLGMRLAMAQMKACLIEIVQNWELHLNPKTRKDIAVASSTFLLVQEGGIWIDFKRIK